MNKLYSLISVLDYWRLVGDAYKRRIRRLGIKYPNHGHRFDLKADEGNIDSAFNTKVYSIKVEADSILIDFD